MKGEVHKMKNTLPYGWVEKRPGEVIINDATYSKKDRWEFINYSGVVVQT